MRRAAAAAAQIIPTATDLPPMTLGTMPTNILTGEIRPVPIKNPARAMTRERVFFYTLIWPMYLFEAIPYLKSMAI